MGGTRGSRLANALWRIGLAVAYRAQLAWWFAFRPVKTGACVAVWHAGRVLVIRHSYKPLASLPAGGVHRGEDPAAAAARELREEVGIGLAPEALRFARRIVGPASFKTDDLFVFEVECAQEPTLAIDEREVVEAAFRAPEELLAARIDPHLRTYLSER